MDDHRMDHSPTVSWDKGIADSWTLSPLFDDFVPDCDVFG